ncbi:MAG: glycerol-3-phosphate acyltransferase [Bacillota bacterium]|nr:glycerol-3-phosphate acyltransferase [Bacillota bacterium]
MEIGMKICAFMLTYLLGSIPSAYLVGKQARGIDIRSHGSGNVGTMNTRAVLGWPCAILVFIMDVAKGVLAVYLGTLLSMAAMTAACMAVVGHIFPLWLGFRGGKGLATAFGAMLAAGGWGIILAFIIGWLLVFPFFKQVDQANLAGSLVILLYGLASSVNTWLLVMVIILALKHIPEVFSLN